MGSLRQFVTPLHRATARDYLGRMTAEKPACMAKAQAFEADYWDGDRRFGYGGYRYLPGRWKPVAEALLQTYDLKPGARVLDVGCGKAFLLYEMQQLQPALALHGVDVSAHALQHTPPDLKASLIQHRAQDPLPHADQEFDLVISLGCLHNLPLPDLVAALKEIARVGRRAYVMVESFRNNRELCNLQCWALTCRAFFAPEEWQWLFDHVGYRGDYEFIFSNKLTAFQ